MAYIESSSGRIGILVCILNYSVVTDTDLLYRHGTQIEGLRVFADHTSHPKKKKKSVHDRLVLCGILCLSSCLDHSRCRWHTHLTNQGYFDYRKNLKIPNMSPMPGQKWQVLGCPMYIYECSTWPSIYFSTNKKKKSMYIFCTVFILNKEKNLEIDSLISSDICYDLYTLTCKLLLWVICVQKQYIIIEMWRKNVD